MPRLPELGEQLCSLVDEEVEAVEVLDRTIAEHGWPGLRLVGADGADAAWLIAQRAIEADDLRRVWLPRLREAVASGDADPRHYATLADGMAAEAGEPQPYGTLAMRTADGETDFRVPVADPGSLDARRAELGLPSIAADAPYLADELIPYGTERRAVPVNQWPMVVEGHVSVEAALEASVRPIHRIWAVRPGDRRLGRLRTLARERSVLIDQVEPQLIDDLARGRTHGGVIGLVGARRTLSVQQLLAEVGEQPLVVMLDGIEDPFNYGQAVRALYASGVDGLLVSRSWETALPIVTRSSGGATELMPTASAATALEAAATCREAGLRIASADPGAAATELHAADLRGGLFLLIGGERRGVTRALAGDVDVAIRIGYGRERAPELGAAAAAAIIGFEALRQRS